MKNREKNVLKTMYFFDIDFSSFFFFFFDFSRFWLDFGRPRGLQKLLKIIKKRFRAVFGVRLGFGCDFKSDVGAILEDFGWILGVFWKDFNGFLGGFWDTNDN